MSDAGTPLLDFFFAALRAIVIFAAVLQIVPALVYFERRLAA